MRTKLQLFLIAFCSALSGLLFGYDAGIISGALLFINKTFVMSQAVQGWLVAMVPVGALLSSLVSGKFCDLVGRKFTLFLTALCFAIGSLLCIVPATGIEYLLGGRLLLGIAIGIGSCVSPIYTSELASEDQRGWLVNLFVTFIQLGVFLSFAVSYGLSTTGNWQLMIGLGVIPAIILGLAVFLLPESPRWLVLHGKADGAFAILCNLYGEAKARSEVANIAVVTGGHQLGMRELLHQHRFFKVLFIGIAVSVFTQTVGINAFNYYAPTIFQETGFATPAAATFYTMFMGLTLVLSTVGSLFFIDRVGRRKPLLWGTAGIMITLLTITGGFLAFAGPMVLGWLFLLSAIVFMAFHGVSIGPACFLIPSEIFPNQIRGLGMGISVACNWAANVVVAAMVPTIIANYGVAVLFGMFFAMTFVGWVVFYLYVPETKGTTLEQIERNVLMGVRSVDLGRVVTSQ